MRWNRERRSGHKGSLHPLQPRLGRFEALVEKRGAAGYLRLLDVADFGFAAAAVLAAGFFGGAGFALAGALAAAGLAGAFPGAALAPAEVFARPRGSAAGLPSRSAIS